MIVLIYYAIIIAVAALDLLTKYLVTSSEYLMGGGIIKIIPGVLQFRYVENEGAAMGMLSDNRWVFMTLSSVSIVGIAAALAIMRKKLKHRYGIALGMVVGGGIGNMYERVFNGELLGKGVVTDFIDFCAFPKIWMWVFNVADIFVCVGAALFVIFYIIDIGKEYKKSKTGDADTESEEARSCLPDGMQEDLQNAPYTESSENAPATDAEDDS